MTATAEHRRNFPRQFHLEGITITCRPLSAESKEAVINFARELPEEDLLFLDRDITQPAVVDRWVQDVADGDLLTIVACQSDVVIGYATIYHGRARWSRHVAELRVVVAESARGKGLGRLMLQLVFEIALQDGATKLVARMTPQQTSAQSLFQHLGFAQEAVLQDNAMDANGITHDLLLLSYHTRQHPDKRCGSCGVPVLKALNLDGARLCSQCFEARYAELGSGD